MASKVANQRTERTAFENVVSYRPIEYAVTQNRKPSLRSTVLTSRSFSCNISFLSYLDLPLHKECFGYKWLTESDRNERNTSTTINCDSGLSAGWYRFGGGAGIEMPTSCVPENRCGTHATGWINGAHPTVSDGNVTRTVCYNWNGNCCNWSNNIEVVSCGPFYVYKLSRTRYCRLRYCGSDGRCWSSQNRYYLVIM